jgi:hypothetical protein
MSSYKVSECIVTLNHWKKEEEDLKANIEWTAKLLKLQRKALKAHQIKVANFKTKFGILQSFNSK